MIPDRLHKGDMIGIVSPSSFLAKETQGLLSNAIEILKKYDLKVVLAKNALAVDKYGVSAGSPEQRASDINEMFANQNIKCISCSKGGDTANGVLELIDYDLIRKNPKIFSGLSDNTVLINAIHHKTGLVTFHGTDLKAGNKDEYFDSEYSHEEFKKRLMDGKIGEINKISEWKCVRKGKAKGKILGGNINCMLKLAGTPYMPDLAGSILLLEGYHLDIKRITFLFAQLKQMGVFDKIAGIVVGYVYGFEKDEQCDKEGNRVYFEDILLEATKDYPFPILKMQEFGHKCPSTVLPIGCMAELDAGQKSFRILEPCVK